MTSADFQRGQWRESQIRQDAVRTPQAGPLRLATENVELLPERSVLEQEVGAWSEHVTSGGEEGGEDGEHVGRAS